LVADANGLARCPYGSAGRNDNAYTPPAACSDQIHRTSPGNGNDHLKIKGYLLIQLGLVAYSKHTVHVLYKLRYIIACISNHAQ
jgi:hypothetical protein